MPVTSKNLYGKSKPRDPLMEHTPTPWTAKANADGEYRLHDAEYHDVGVVDGSEDQDINEDNAAFIVRACNAHDELVAALRYVEARLASVAVPSQQPEVSRAFADLREVARAALAKVKP